MERAERTVAAGTAALAWGVEGERGEMVPVGKDFGFGGRYFVAGTRATGRGVNRAAKGSGVEAIETAPWRSRLGKESRPLGRPILCVRERHGVGFGCHPVTEHRKHKYHDTNT